jgi:hypothetical protein
MKKVLSVVVIAALMLFSSVSKAGVVFQLSSPSAGLVTIGYAATANTAVRGLALNVQLSNNATAVYSDIVSINPAFNVFIDYAFAYPGYNIGDGHPFANPGAPSPVISPVSFFSISMGVLGPTGGGAPAVVPNLLTFRIQDGGAGFSSVTLSPDALRGGVVGDNIGTVTMPQPLLVTIPEPCTLLLLGLGVMLLRARE